MPNGKIELNWADGTYAFNIAKVAQALELEEKCGVGVAEIFDRLRTGRWWVNDVRETLRLGLIGGGLEPIRALKIVRRYVDERPWSESVQVALAVLMAAIVGVPGDDVGKKPAAEPTANEDRPPSSAPMDGSSAPPSTASAPDSAGIPASSTN